MVSYLALCTACRCDDVSYDHHTACTSRVMVLATSSRTRADVFFLHDLASEDWKEDRTSASRSWQDCRIEEGTKVVLFPVTRHIR
ncbi:hypothetical protein MRB53_037329 [Persea americana]|nr:hypothetical protein MRB53_037329 [Persea americana]